MCSKKQAAELEQLRRVQEAYRNAQKKDSMKSQLCEEVEPQVEVKPKLTPQVEKTTQKKSPAKKGRKGSAVVKRKSTAATKKAQRKRQNARPPTPPSPPSPPPALPSKDQPARRSSRKRVVRAEVAAILAMGGECGDYSSSAFSSSPSPSPSKRVRASPTKKRTRTPSPIKNRLLDKKAFLESRKVSPAVAAPLSSLASPCPPKQSPLVFSPTDVPMIEDFQKKEPSTRNSGILMSLLEANKPRSPAAASTPESIKECWSVQRKGEESSNWEVKETEAGSVPASSSARGRGRSRARGARGRGGARRGSSSRGARGSRSGSRGRGRGRKTSATADRGRRGRSGSYSSASGSAEVKKEIKEEVAEDAKSIVLPERIPPTESLSVTPEVKKESPEDKKSIGSAREIVKAVTGLIDRKFMRLAPPQLFAKSSSTPSAFPKDKLSSRSPSVPAAGFSAERYPQDAMTTPEQDELIRRIEQNPSSVPPNHPLVVSDAVLYSSLHSNRPLAISKKINDVVAERDAVAANAATSSCEGSMVPKKTDGKPKASPVPRSSSLPAIPPRISAENEKDLKRWDERTLKMLEAHKRQFSAGDPSSSLKAASPRKRTLANPRRHESLANALGLRYRRVPNLICSKKVVSADSVGSSSEAVQRASSSTVTELGGALTQRYFEEVFALSQKTDHPDLHVPTGEDIQREMEQEEDFTRRLGGMPPSPPSDGEDEQQQVKLEADAMSAAAAKMKTLRANLKPEAPPCQCFPDGHAAPESGPYYTHLGVGKSVEEIRAKFEDRVGCDPQELRIERARYCMQEGKGVRGCPVAKWVIRRSSLEEKYLLIVKYRTGHTCETSHIVVSIVAWEGVEAASADRAYDELAATLGSHGYETHRKCGMNSEKRCACQGVGNDSGASFSFGCSWSHFMNMCKYARSDKSAIHKFRLREEQEEPRLESCLQDLATAMAPLYKRMAPDAHANQVAFESVAPDCRIGRDEHGAGRPFSGITSVVDFCAHAHRDNHNMMSGSTVVVTLNKPENRQFKTTEPPEDEQLHVLPHYAPDDVDEWGSREGQERKIQEGSLQRLSKFHRVDRIFDQPQRKSVIGARKGRLSLPVKRGRGRGRARGRTGRLGRARDWPLVKKEEVLPSEPAPPFRPVVEAGRRNNTNFPDQCRLLQQQLLMQRSTASYAPQRHMTNFGLTPVAKGASSVANTAGFAVADKSFGGLPITYAGPADQRVQLPLPPPPSSPPWKPLPGLSSAVPVTSALKEVTTGEKRKADQQPSAFGSSCYSQDMMKDAQKRLCATVAQAPLPQHHSHNLRSSPRQPASHSAIVVPTQPAFAQSTVQTPDLSVPQVDGTAGDDLEPPQVEVRQTVLTPAGPVGTGLQGPAVPVVQQPVLPAQVPFSHPPQFTHRQYQPFPPVPPVAQPPSQGHLASWKLTPPSSQTGSPNGVFPIKTEDVAAAKPTMAPTPPEPPRVREEETDNEHLFQHDDIGGLAIALTHGSVLFECAKHELHATTALKRPNRRRPTRIGLVFYQHKTLNFPNHGWEAQIRLREKNVKRREQWEARVSQMNERDYLAWLMGDFVPTEERLAVMREDGLPFPPAVETVVPGSALLLGAPVAPPDRYFLATHPAGGRWIQKLAAQEAVASASSSSSIVLKQE